MKNIKTIRGIRDIYYPDSEKWNTIINGSEKILSGYGYRKIYLPVIEYTELFSGSIGEDTDIVSKEMYAFQDKKGRNLALRPEGTAGAVRAMIEGRRLEGTVREKIYYFGPMFRYEKPQEGRYRQFYQLGCEIFGSSSPYSDAELAETALEIVKYCGINDFNLKINSVGCNKCRRLYRDDIKNYLADKTDRLCPDCQRRLGSNTLRILDCKNRKCKEIYKELPELRDFLCEGCADYYGKYKEILSSRGIVFTEDTRLVRGLDYYTGPVFELESDSSVIAAGGRYDALVKQLGGPQVPACGFAFGIERLEAASKKQAAAVPMVYIARLQGGDEEKCRKIAQELRSRNISVEEDYEDISPGKKMKIADKKNIMWVVIIGEEESKSNMVSLKNLRTGQQKTIPAEELEKDIGVK